MSESLTVNAAVVIPAGELRWRAVRASGPGGQNVNKVASKIELRFDVRASRVIDGATKARLADLAGARLGSEGELLVTSQLTRDQQRNLEDARAKLADLVRRALVRPKKRRPTKPSRSAQRARLDTKRHHSQKKESRRTKDD